MSLQLWLPAKRSDYVLFWTFVIGVVGIVIHFWTFTPLGIAGSGILIYIAFVGVGVRVINGMPKAKAPGFVKLHIIFSFANLFIAALWGIMLALNKVYGFLSTPFTANLYAHIHLAAIGWVIMMIFGFAYRLVPMFLPGEPPKGIWPWISGILLESGVLMIFLSLLFKPEWLKGSAIIILIGILIFIRLISQTVLKRKPVPPPAPPIPDFSILHVLSAFLWLITSAIFGIILLYLVPEQRMRFASTYGFIALVNGMSQIIIGMRPKLLSIFTWYHVFTDQKSTENLPRPIDMGNRKFQRTAFAMWTIGTIAFAASLLTSYRKGILLSSILLGTALALTFLNERTILKRMI